MESDQLKLHKMVLEDTTLSFEQKKEMLNEIRKIMPADQNRWNFRYAILPLAITALSAPAYTLIALICDKPNTETPEVLLTLSSTALGAIAAFLTGYREKSNGPSPTVQELPNTSNNPTASPPVL